MTPQEFYELTGVSVSSREFEAIHIVYMESDLDKFQFCKMWMKMNKSRVQLEAERAIEEQKRIAKREVLWNIIMEYGSIATCSDYMHHHLAVSVLSDEQVSKLESMGIEMQEEDYGIGVRRFKTMSTILYEIDKILKAA